MTIAVIQPRDSEQPVNRILTPGGLTVAVVNGAPVDGPLRKRNYTRQEWRVLQLLLDGNGHSLLEVHSLLEDDLSGMAAAKLVVSRVRSKLDRFGFMIPNHKGLYYIARKVLPGEIE